MKSNLTFRMASYYENIVWFASLNIHAHDGSAFNILVDQSLEFPLLVIKDSHTSIWATHCKVLLTCSETVWKT